MAEELHPRDVLEGMLYFYPDETFENDRETIHTAIYEIREKHFDFFGDITFRKNILFPRSRVLDELLSSLQPGILSKSSGDGRYQINKKNLGKAWKNYLMEKFAGNENQLQRMAEEFYSLMNPN